jgi:hypothetical protein
MSMIDLAVVGVEFSATAMLGPGSKQGIDQAVKVLAFIVVGIDQIAAVAVDLVRL